MMKTIAKLLKVPEKYIEVDRQCYTREPSKLGKLKIAWRKVKQEYDL